MIALLSAVMIPARRLLETILMKEEEHAPRTWSVF